MVAPENTLPAFDSAIRAGADMLELDVNISSDKKLVIIHDYHLGRTVDQKGSVSDYLFDELIKMDAGSHFNASFNRVCIPSCEEVMQLSSYSGVPVCYEIKGENPKQAIRIAESLMALIQKFGINDLAFISSYFPEAVKVARKINPFIKVARERLPDDSPFCIEKAIAQAADDDAQIMLSDFKTISSQNVDDLHSAGLAIWAWNPVSEEEILNVIAMGCDGIMGDNPGVARRLVNTIQKILINQVKQEDVVINRFSAISMQSFPMVAKT